MWLKALKCVIDNSVKSGPVQIRPAAFRMARIRIWRADNCAGLLSLLRLSLAFRDRIYYLCERGLFVPLINKEAMESIYEPTCLSPALLLWGRLPLKQSGANITSLAHNYIQFKAMERQRLGRHKPNSRYQQNGCNAISGLHLMESSPPFKRIRAVCKRSLSLDRAPDCI